MKNLQCPKCRSTDVVRLPGEVRPPATLSGAKSPSGFKTISLTRYCCAACGYTEEWVDDPKDLQDVLKKFGF